jgi:hypothetical protein
MHGITILAGPDELGGARFCFDWARIGPQTRNIASKLQSVSYVMRQVSPNMSRAR